MAAVTQIGHDTPGRAYYLRKLAEGEARKEALRALKRRLSDAVWRQLQTDLAPLTTRAREDTRDDSSIQRGRLNPEHRHFGPVTPGPPTLRPPKAPLRRAPTDPLTTKRLRSALPDHREVAAHISGPETGGKGHATRIGVRSVRRWPEERRSTKSRATRTGTCRRHAYSRTPPVHTPATAPPPRRPAAGVAPANTRRFCVQAPWLTRKTTTEPRNEEFPRAMLCHALASRHPASVCAQAMETAHASVARLFRRLWRSMPPMGRSGIYGKMTSPPIGSRRLLLNFAHKRYR